MPRQHQRIRFMRKEDLLLLFGETDNRNSIHQFKSLKHLDCASQLTLTAINDDQVWKEGKRRILLDPRLVCCFLSRTPATESARQHFLHGSEIIRSAHHAFNVEFTI